MNPQLRDKGWVSGRLAKAQQFSEAASLFVDDVAGVVDLSDAYVTLAIHSGIASADVLCATRLGRYSTGSSHHDALSLLKRAVPSATVHLARLLEMKTRAGYSHRGVAVSDVQVARTAHEKLLDMAVVSASR